MCDQVVIFALFIHAGFLDVCNYMRINFFFLFEFLINKITNREISRDFQNRS